MNLSDMACQIRAKCEYGLTDCALVAISRRIFGRNPTNFWRCLRLSSCGSCKVVSKPSSEVTLIQEAIPKHATYHALVFTVSKLLEYEPTICTWSEHTIQPTIHSQKIWIFDTDSQIQSEVQNHQKPPMHPQKQTVYSVLMAVFLVKWLVFLASFCKSKVK